MDVAEAIDAEAVPVAWTSVAAAGGAWHKPSGKWIPGAATPVNIMATIQPVSGKVLQDVPEGIRPDVSYVFWTRTGVRVNDRLTYDGTIFRVLHVWPRPMDGFCKGAMGNVKS